MIWPLKKKSSPVPAKQATGTEWRRLLPSPIAYYSERLKLQGWARAECPFHDDRETSLRVNIDNGRWYCNAGCGKGDLVGFHMRQHGLSSRAAITDLLPPGTVWKVRE